jgi:hypothetical protein
MAWVTFQIWPKEGGLLPVHWKAVDGLRRDLAQGLLSEGGGHSSLGRKVSSSQESESECSGCGGDRPFWGWASIVKLSFAGVVSATACTRYAVKKGCGSFTRGYLWLDVEAVVVDDILVNLDSHAVLLLTPHKKGATRRNVCRGGRDSEVQELLCSAQGGYIVLNDEHGGVLVQYIIRST